MTDTFPLPRTNSTGLKIMLKLPTPGLPSVDGSAGSRSTDPEKKDKDKADTDQMINDEVVEEIKKFKG